MHAFSETRRSRVSKANRFIALICALTIITTMPTAAWAAPSNSNQTTASSGGMTATVTDKYNSPDGGIALEATPVTAHNYKAPSQGDAIVGRWRLYTWGNFDRNSVHDLPITVYAGTQYMGMMARIYIEEDDGAFDYQEVRVRYDGTITFNVKRLSYLDSTYITAAIAKGQDVIRRITVRDMSPVSPKTGDPLNNANPAPQIGLNCVTYILSKSFGE